MPSPSSVVERFVSAVNDEGLGAYGVHVLVGDEQAQHRWRSDDRENIYSASKGICAVAVGIAIDEGLISLDSPVAQFLPGLELGQGVQDVQLHHLLAMTSGVDFRWFCHEPVPWPDLAQEMLRRATRGIGSVFQYSDVNTYVAMRMIGAVVGDVRDWLMPRLFDPLEIHNPQWHRCPLGWIMGGAGLELRTEELARVGRVLRDRGSWHDRQLVSPEWVDRMHDSWFFRDGRAPYERYGLGVWQGPGECWRLDGRYGQYVIVDQERDAVVTVTAHEESREYRLAELAGLALRRAV